MEIDTTKIGKHFLISPTIDANKLRAYDDIIVSGTSFRELFDGSETNFIDARDTLIGYSYQAEQIHAFKCDVSDYVGGLFKSATLRHDANTSGTTAGTSEVWLFVTIFDENSNIVDTFFSLNKAQQTSISTTWTFDSIEIKNNYKIFEFRITSTEGVANRNPSTGTFNLRSFSIKDSSGRKLLRENWTTVEQNGVEAQYTTDCFLEIENHRLNIKSEIDSIKNDLNSHVSNHDIHLNSSEINSLIRNNDYITECITSHSTNTPHLSEENVTDIITSSVLSSDVTRLKEDVSSIEENISLIEETSKFNKSIINGYLDTKISHTYDVCFEETNNRFAEIVEEVIISFATDTKVFTGDNISSVSVRKKQGDTYNALPIASTPAWLYALCCDENNNVIKVVFSTNNTTQNPNEAITTWYFDNFFITSDIKTIQYFITFNEGVQEKTNKLRSASIRANGKKIVKDGWHTIDGANNKVEFITDVLINHDSYSDSNSETSLLTTSLPGDVLDKYVVSSFQLGRLHLKPGKIKKIFIPYTSSTSETTGTNFLAVQIFKYGDVDTAEQNKSKEETIYSEEDFTINNGNNGYYYYYFKNLIIPDDFHYVRFMLVSSKDVLPNGISMNNCNYMRIQPIKRNNDFLTFDTDECSLTDKNGTKLNYLTLCDFVYEGDVHQTEKYFSSKWRLEFDGIRDYIKNIYADIVNSPYITIQASKLSKNDIIFNLDTSSSPSVPSFSISDNIRDYIIMDINFSVPVSNVYVENYIKRYSDENLPLIIPIF